MKSFYIPNIDASTDGLKSGKEIVERTEELGK